MPTTSLSQFISHAKKGIAYIPLGTIEWHGNHLPVETDFLVAQKLCELFRQKTGGYVLPPIWLGTDRDRTVQGKTMIGMNARLKKELQGNLYYLKPKAMFDMIDGLVMNLIKQGFTKIYLVTGHGGSKQIEMLEKIQTKHAAVRLVNPLRGLSVAVHHADEFETSLLWACYPEEEAVSRKKKISMQDDYFAYMGYDPRSKASLAIGKKMIQEIMANFKRMRK